MSNNARDPLSFPRDDDHDHFDDRTIPQNNGNDLQLIWVEPEVERPKSGLVEYLRELKQARAQPNGFMDRIRRRFQRK